MVFSYISLMIAITLGIAGQIALKTGSLSINHHSIFSLFQPYTILGFACYFASALFYIYSLRQIPISVALPCVSLNYAIVALLGHFMWNEPFGLQHWTALVLILSGVFLLVRA